jgi:hypothetical protein
MFASLCIPNLLVSSREKIRRKRDSSQSEGPTPFIMTKLTSFEQLKGSDNKSYSPMGCTVILLRLSESSQLTTRIQQRPALRYLGEF